MGSEETKRRILEAATAEFAAHGLAGARVDRIAASAGVNKERIYAYFGDKGRLFQLVVHSAVEQSISWLTMRAEGLPAIVTEFFDAAFERPELIRLLDWWRLEGSDGDLPEQDLEPYRQKIADIRATQAAGEIDPSWDPVDLIVIASALAIGWAVTARALRQIASDEGAPPRERRDAMREAMRRIVASS